jgi:hypothetical protein
MMRGDPGGGAVGSLGLVALPLAPGVLRLPGEFTPGALRLLGLELSSDPLKLPPGPLPTVGLFGRIAGWFG